MGLMSAICYFCLFLQSTDTLADRFLETLKKIAQFASRPGRDVMRGCVELMAKKKEKYLTLLTP